MIELRNFNALNNYLRVMMQHLPLTLPDFKKASILVVGDVMLDRYWFGDTSRISPEAPVPVVKINNIDHRPGGAGNVALNIAALGCKITLLGVLGQDEAGAILKQQLDAAGVSSEFCISQNNATIIKLRVISKHQQLIRLDFEERLRNINSLELNNKYQALLPQTDMVVISDYNKGTLTDPQLFIQAARDAKVPVLVDPKGSQFDIYRGATIITPNFKEFEAVVGVCRNEQEIIEKAQNLIDEFEIKKLLVTRGENGMTLVSNEAVHHFPAFAREIFDVTGAGDTVIGTLGAGLAAGADFEMAASLANLAASLVVGKFGAATISVPELQVALTGKTNFASGIVNEEQLCNAVKQAKAQGKRIIFTNGCFDVLHAGHVTYLQMAKQLGDYLIVAVNKDESIKKLKGPNRPVNNLEHRMTVLAGLGVVDWVVPFAEKTPEHLLKVIKPDLLVKGDDYTLDQVVGAEIVKAYGGEVRIMNVNIDTSSTKILNRMRQAESLKCSEEA